MPILAEAGHWPSQQMQDGRSYRYAIVNAGGTTHEDALRRALECRRRLDFQFDGDRTLRRRITPALESSRLEPVAHSAGSQG